MKLIHAVSLAVSLARAAATAASQTAPVYAPPPSGYYGDYGPPLRYVLALRGRNSSQAHAQQIGIQQPFDGRLARSEIVECCQEQSGIVRRSRIDAQPQRSAVSDFRFHRFRQ